MPRSIESVARQFLDTAWDGQIPVAVLAMANRVGVSVFFADIGDTPVVYRRAAVGGEILLRKDDPLPRRRFGLAHALGLHVMTDLPEKHISLADFGAPAEAQASDANQFALAILMPQESVPYVVQQLGKPSIEALAATFAVSEVAVAARLRGLRIT